MKEYPMDVRRRPRDASLLASASKAAAGEDGVGIDTAMATAGSPNDMTETQGTGSDEVELAYGSAFYLQEEYLQRLRQRSHRQEASGEESDNEDGDSKGVTSKGTKGAPSHEADLMVNTRHQPLFFRLGKDFPPMAPSTTPDDGEETGAADGLLTALPVQEDKSSIILPVVSPMCRLAQSATKGSASLAFLRRQQEVERATREAMDTSKSDLARLLRKGDAGQQAAEGHLGTGSYFSNVELKKTGNEDGLEEDETEMLRQKVRKETARLERMVENPAHNAVASAATEKEDVEKEERSRQQEIMLRRRQEKLERVQEARDRLAKESSHVEDYAAKRLALMALQRQLPIYRCKEELLRCIGENPVSIIIGETGSGKTTQLVQYLYQRGYTRGGGIIGCTQPRRLAAIGVARRVSEEMGCALGTRVGYAIHLDDNTTNETEVKFMTDGVLLREVVRDPDVSKYSVIVLDEAHERSVNTDVLLGVLQSAVRRRSDLKLVVTSATMDILKFSKFFGNAPFYEIPGQTYDVDVQYAAAPVEDYVAEAVFRICQLHIQMPLEGKHDILVFMTGRDDVLGTCELVRRRLREMDPKWLETLLVLPCLSEAVSAGASGVLDTAPPGMRKCVVATNVAETSLTIDGVRYVIDCGFMKTNVFRPKLGMNTLQRYPVSQAQANQRKGRAGRTTEGLCFRLYTEAQFLDEMLPSSVPEIQRSSIDSVVLLLKSIGVARLVDFDFMDPPPAANICRSMWQLWVLGLLDDSGAITADGRQALEFPLAPSLAKVLVESAGLGCGVEAVRIVSMISADPKQLFELPKDREEMARQHHGRFYVNESDHLTLLNVMTHFLENGKSRQWAKDHFLHVPTLLRACEVQQQLLERMRMLGLPTLSCGPKGMDLVRQCVTSGFCLQSAQRSSSNWSEYRPLLNSGVVCYVHPSSAVYVRSEMPLYVVYHDLLLTTREYLVVVTAVERDWLIEASRGVFCTKSLTRDTKKASNAPPTSCRPHATLPAGVGNTASVGSSTQLGKPRQLPSVTAQPKGTMLPSKRRHNI
ncbi:hypothetical protein ECC02_003506 [Trypanosoma cruzi]|uniref:RNA helicase n=1 Tax=Trypanosoma cruzi TaxID=5693 RepID=A0A7J6Y9X5_TRYCR|nr:hypothetical protein ECC02_003506 [Trypanosoma cruzi]